MFYTYIHRKRDIPGVEGIFYVGKGKARRAWQCSRRSEWWKRIVDKYGFVVEIVAYWHLEQSALDYECFLIAELKAKGAPLVNLTEGGEGARLTPEMIKIRAQTLNATNQLQEVKDRRSVAMRLMFENPEYKNRHAEAMRRAAAEGLSKKQEVIKKLHADEEVQKKRKKSLKIAAADPEYREKKRQISLRNGNEPPHLFGADHPGARAVECIETGKIFPTIRSAVAYLKSNGFPNAIDTGVCNACSGRAKSAYGHRWRYSCQSSY